MTQNSSVPLPPLATISVTSTLAAALQPSLPSHLPTPQTSAHLVIAGFHSCSGLGKQMAKSQGLTSDMLTGVLAQHQAAELELFQRPNLQITQKKTN